MSVAVQCEDTMKQARLEKWFRLRNKQIRTAIEYAAAITFYRQQTSVPVVRTLV